MWHGFVAANVCVWVRVRERAWLCDVRAVPLQCAVTFDHRVQRIAPRACVRDSVLFLCARKGDIRSHCSGSLGFVHLSIYLSIYLPFFRTSFLSSYQSFYLPSYLSIQPIYPFYPSIHLHTESDVGGARVLGLVGLPDINTL